jgi:hypothetical protein
MAHILNRPFPDTRRIGFNSISVEFLHPHDSGRTCATCYPTNRRKAEAGDDDADLKPMPREMGGNCFRGRKGAAFHTQRIFRAFSILNSIRGEVCVSKERITTPSHAVAIAIGFHVGSMLHIVGTWKGIPEQEDAWEQWLDKMII